CKGNRICVQGTCVDPAGADSAMVPDLAGHLDLTMQPTPDGFLADQSPPADQTMPDSTMPDLAMPDLAMPDLAMPDLAMPDLAMPDLAAPDLAMPDLAMPDLAMLGDAGPLQTVAFAAPVQSFLAGTLTDVIAGDWNKDGKIDYAAAGGYLNIGLNQ